MQDNTALNALIQTLRRLPGVGQRSASRMAFHLLQHDPQGAMMISQALQNAVSSVR
ncbi:MAG: recombination protein RecR, partial [Betaproteobacteria bacterium]|nr:recombination protein RecR [Betaproteobacteria bacterium]